MRALYILAKDSLEEALSSRLILVSLVAAAVLLYLGEAVSALAAEEETRALLDLGLGLIELVTLGIAIFGGAVFFLREGETKRADLILSRPIGRARYLLGRFLGLALTAGVSLLLTSALHLALLLFKGWLFTPAYLYALLGIYLKVLIALSMTLGIALWSTSALAAMGFSALLWSLGHFLPEVGELLGRGGTSLVWLKPVLWIPPNLSFLNYRDVMSLAPGFPPVGAWFAYAGAYAGLWLLIAWDRLRLKEF